MKIFKAVVRLYANQLICMFISLILIMPLFSVAEKLPYLFSAITAFIYIAVMYSSAWRVGFKDARKIPGYFPDMRLPLQMSVFSAIVPVVLLIVRIARPDIWPINLPFMRGEYDFFVKGCVITGTPDLIYRLWFFHFAGFIPSGSIVAYAVQILILPIIIYCGYIVGLRRFSIIEFLYARVVFASDPAKATGKRKKHRREDNLRS